MAWLDPQTPSAPSGNPPSPAGTPVLIDVRSAGEYATGFVDGSINLPLDRFAQEIESLVPSKSTPVLLFCASGARSAQACQYMQHLGYTAVVNGGGAGMVAMQLGRPVRRA